MKTSTNTTSIADVNLAFVAGLAETWMKEPRAVSEDWRVWFEGLTSEQLADIVGVEAVAGWEARRAARQGGRVVSGGEAPGGWAQADQLRLDWATRELIREYRDRGHLYAAINPLRESTPAVHIDLQSVGLSEADLERMVYTGDMGMSPHARLRDVVGMLEYTWCGPIGYEIMHIEDTVERRWLLDRIQASGGRAQLDPGTRRWVLEKLTEANLLEQFLGRKFLGAKRFSVEGMESMIPMLAVMIEVLGEHAVREVILGMAHRGRLSVLINIMGQALQDLFVAFKDHDAVSQLGGGDVKYHMGRSRDLTTRSGRMLHLSLCFNPSHLEFVNPVVEGRVRAKQDRVADADGASIVPILIHGDAAVIGQGIVAETLNMAQLEGYRTGGTIHLVLNNQVGFTTNPSDSRSTRYCTDISKIIGVPVLHVNGEDLDAVFFAASLAAEYRQTFRRDIFIDLIAYRRHGHNEGDEPRFTQPQMYGVIDNKRSIRDLYRDQLIARGDMTEADDQALLERVNAHMERALEEATDALPHPKPSSGEGLWTLYKGGAEQDEPAPTSVDKDRLKALLEGLSTPPEGFTPHRKLWRLLEGRREIAAEQAPVDWATAEHLAFASLLAEGHPVRLSGQDVQRGTFAHRHAVLADPDTGRTWTPLEGLAARPGLLRLYNSPLSEAGVLGFEFGYSLDCPEGLIIWEAQFGDFANGAQVIIDQFISSTEDKWRRLSGLVLLLPHGFEGQGPEHSSARLERFLQQCAEDNMQVCNLTTPAQLFHALRRQIVRPLRKPLIVMSPKSLLRHKSVRSTLDDLATGTFQRILGDEQDVAPDSIRRVLLCSGRIYYDLVDEREKRGAHDVAILRFEQLYPLSRDIIREALAPYTDAARFYWVQDEPWNMGAWHYIQARLRDVRGRGFPVNCISRASSASPATGSHASHKYEQEHLLELAFGRNGTDKNGSVREEEV